MPEYLSPGVYIEEVSFRSRTIEGVSTSTAAFIGPTRFGPVSGEPELITSLADFQRIYGDLENLTFTDQGNPQINYLAHGVRAFFEEGGRRLFVQRVFNAPRVNGFGITNGVPTFHYATADTLAAALAPDMLTPANNELAAATQIATDVAAAPPTVEATTATAAARDAWIAAVAALTDLNAGTALTLGDVTTTATELGNARTSLATARTNLAAAQTVFDADPTVQANVDALVAAVATVDFAQDAVESAHRAWIAANTALQIEQIQPAAVGELPLRIVARFPGAAGDMRATFALRAGNNVYQPQIDQPNPRLNRLQNGSLVHVRRRATATDPWALDANTLPDGLMIANYDQVNGLWTLNGDNDGAPTSRVLDGAFRTGLGTAQFEVRPLTVIVSVERPTGEIGVFEAEETLGEFAFEPERRNWFLNTLTRNPENRFSALTTPIAVELPTAIQTPTALAIARHLMVPAGLLRLLDQPLIEFRYNLSNGNDGDLPIAANYEGLPDLVDYSGDILQMPLNGLLAFETVEDISIVAAPGYSTAPDQDAQLAIQNALINHCERMRYRVAVLDTPENNTITEALNFRNLRSSDYAAIYYPWIYVSDPRPSQGGRRLKLPPSGFMAGIYARNDTENAVFKAPANEVVRLALDFEVKVNQAQQDILNPNGVNCLRFFEGRGYLVWGARTISDDPEWKYISLRRYFAYLERSIDRATQWTVFENNGPDLWGKLRRSVEDFLYNEWVAGGLLGNKPELAYFVRCDRSTMTQNDLDNGRLVCLIGVAPVKPAEFVIFRIGQWTADATN